MKYFLITVVIPLLVIILLKGVFNGYSEVFDAENARKEAEANKMF